LVVVVIVLVVVVVVIVLIVVVVSVPVRRPPVKTIAGPVVFWHRALSGIDTQKARTELVTGSSGTLEQAILDLADRPALGGLSPSTATEALWDLATRANWLKVFQLSELQGRPSAYAGQYGCGRASELVPRCLRASGGQYLATA